MRKVITLAFICSAIGIGLWRLAPSIRGQKSDSEATLVQPGQVTPKERAYSDEFKKLYPHWRRKLTDQIGRPHGSNGNSELRSIETPPDASVWKPDMRSRPEVIEELFCESDLIVVGIVTGRASHLSSDETFLFTTYDLNVQSILKADAQNPVREANEIEVTRPGGRVEVNGQVLSMEDQSYEPLKSSKSYLLFLKRVAGADGYMVANPLGDFVLEDGMYLSLSARLPAKNFGSAAPEQLQSEIQQAATHGCAKQKEAR